MVDNQALSFADFAASIGVMKPNSVKKDDEKAKAKLDKLLDDPAYVIEEKIDGIHYKMVGTRFFSKDNNEKTDNFPHLKAFFEKLKMSNLILDGEINYPGKTSQYCLHVTGAYADSAIHFQEQNDYIHFTIFDLLRTPKGNWLLRNTFEERRRTLEYFYNTFVVGTEMEKYIHLTPLARNNKREFLQRILDAGLEGAFSSA
jgi:ATP-dependent DNA ligase